MVQDFVFQTVIILQVINMFKIMIVLLNVLIIEEYGTVIIKLVSIVIIDYI